MLVLLLAFLVSLIPSLAFFFWLRRLPGEDFVPMGNRAFIDGVLCILGVVVCSGTLHIGGRLITNLLLGGGHGIGWDFYYKFFVLAFAEELVKFLFFRRVLGKFDRDWSWLDIIIVMTLVGIGFGLAEDIPYALSTNEIQMLVRGVTVGHGVYGFIMGWFMGKAAKTGDIRWAAIGFVLPWFLHGLYDFTLTDELIAMNDNIVFIPVLLAFFDFVMVFAIIFKMRKWSKDPVYTEPIGHVLPAWIRDPNVASTSAAAPAPGIPGQGSEQDPGQK